MTGVSELITKHVRNNGGLIPSSTGSISDKDGGEVARGAAAKKQEEEEEEV